MLRAEALNLAHQPAHRGIMGLRGPGKQRLPGESTFTIVDALGHTLGPDSLVAVGHRDAIHSAGCRRGKPGAGLRLFGVGRASGQAETGCKQDGTQPGHASFSPSSCSRRVSIRVTRGPLRCEIAIPMISARTISPVISATLISRSPDFHELPARPPSRASSN